MNDILKIVPKQDAFKRDEVIELVLNAYLKGKKDQQEAAELKRLEHFYGY